MSKSNLKDSQADALAAIALVCLVVGAAVYWVAGL
jgi:hypothetical protein